MATWDWEEKAVDLPGLAELVRQPADDYRLILSHGTAGTAFPYLISILPGALIPGVVVSNGTAASSYLTEKVTMTFSWNRRIWSKNCGEQP